MTRNNSRTLLVTGASGHLGRRVVELLLEAEAGPVVATTRSPEKLADLALRGVVVRKADFDYPRLLTDAFAGADRMLLISTDAIERPGLRLRQHRKAIDAALGAGVKHVVYTSLTNPGADSPVLIAPDHRGTEEVLAASGLSWTILRNNLYTDFLLGSLPQAIAAGKLFAAAASGGAAYVTREDCARAAAAALLSSDASRRILDIMGPAVVGFADLAWLVSDLTGRPVTYIPVEPAALKAGMVETGLPELVADVLVSFQVAMAQGKMGPATSAVEELTGQHPMSVAEFLLQHRDLLVPERR